MDIRLQKCRIHTFPPQEPTDILSAIADVPTYAHGTDGSVGGILPCRTLASVSAAFYGYGTLAGEPAIFAMQHLRARGTSADMPTLAISKGKNVQHFIFPECSDMSTY